MLTHDLSIQLRRAAAAELPVPYQQQVARAIEAALDGYDDLPAAGVRFVQAPFTCRACQRRGASLTFATLGELIAHRWGRPGCPAAIAEGQRAALPAPPLGLPRPRLMLVHRGTA